MRPDSLQDFDIVFVVTELKSFTSDHRWTDFLGEKIISQLPDEMIIGREEPDPVAFHYLMLFVDGNRIDLTLFPAAFLETRFRIDSLTIVWLDKDNLFKNLPPPTNKDYFICKPSEKEFLDTCNEFWWVSTYVAKGLLRNEVTYAKYMLDSVVRPMFMKMIEWKIGLENNFSVSFGTAGKFMTRYLSNDFYNKVLLSYSNAEVEENWKSLLLMAEIFQETSIEVSASLSFSLNKNEQANTRKLLLQKYHDKVN